MKAQWTWLILLFFAAGLAGCDTAHSTSGASKAAPPAKVMQITDEKNLATVTLTPEAEQRLAIATVAVERKKVKRQRTFGGEVVVPPGRSIVVSAPFGGTITIAKMAAEMIPKPGDAVTKGQALFTFLPLLSPERSVLTPSERVRLAEAKASLDDSRAEAQGRVAGAKVEVEAARVELRRAEQLLRDKVGAQKAVDEAKARFSKAQKELEAAVTREALLAKTILDAEAGVLTPTEIRSPRDGMLQNIFVAGGQTVAAGAPLFEVVNRELVWLRVPIYVGELERFDANAPARIGTLNGRPNAETRTAKPVSAPPSANANAATVDLYYELENIKGAFRPGQRIPVILDLQEEENSLVIPWAAVLYDFHGGAWVYRKTQDRTYVRARVQVRYVKGGEAVLASGPQPGALIVTDGAVELFGTEFGNGK